jgi:hypothetical protein
VAPIRAPGLDREQTSKNISPTTKTYKRERQVVKDQERRAGGIERLEGTTAGSVERVACYYSLLRMRTLSISDAEGFLVISCGKVEYKSSYCND